MIKKVLGVLFLLTAALMLLGMFASAAFSDPTLPGPVILGQVIGTLMPVALYVYSGIFLLCFDNAAKLPLAVGFKKRTNQTVSIVCCMVFYFLFFFISCASIDKTDLDNFALRFLLSALPYFIPFIVFTAMMLLYALPVWAARRHFLAASTPVEAYLGDETAFVACSEDGTVMVSDTCLFFPKNFCFVPFSHIANVSLTKQLLEQDIYFHLHNGKKFYIVSKHFATVSALVDQKKQNESV